MKKKIYFKYTAVLTITALIVSIYSSFYYYKTVHADTKDKVIYLTFDDGPSYVVTDEILNILRDKHVKGTFFVVGNKIRYREDILKRIYNEGHSIGLHTYTHKYKKIYASEEAFIQEMDETREEVKRVLGVTSNIIRFPTGSKPHLNAGFLEKLHSHNYKVFDWNASLSDGLNYNTPEDKLFREATKVIGRSSTIMLLLHCDQTNKTTCKALPKIIDYYIEQGYEFRTITDETPEFYFRFKKNVKST